MTLTLTLTLTLPLTLTLTLTVAVTLTLADQPLREWDSGPCRTGAVTDRHTYRQRVARPCRTRVEVVRKVVRVCRACLACSHRAANRCVDRTPRIRTARSRRGAQSPVCPSSHRAPRRGRLTEAFYGRRLSVGVAALPICYI